MKCLLFAVLGSSIGTLYGTFRYPGSTDREILNSFAFAVTVAWLVGIVLEDFLSWTFWKIRFRKDRNL